MVRLAEQSCFQEAETTAPDDFSDAYYSRSSIAGKMASRRAMLRMEIAMIVDQELDAVIRAGMFRDREHAFREAVETMFTVRPHLRTEAGIEMFRSGAVSLLRAAEIAGVDFESFRRLLQDRGIPLEVECDERAHLDEALADFLREPHA